MSGKWRRGGDLDSASRMKVQVGSFKRDRRKKDKKRRIHNRVRDKLAQQLRKMERGATVDLERAAPQWTTTTKDEDGHSRF